MRGRVVVLGCVALAGCAANTASKAPDPCHDRAQRAMPACVLQEPAPATKLGRMPVTVRADARCEWNRTGVRLEDGAQYRLTAAKVVEGWADSWQVESDLKEGWPRLYWLGSLFAKGHARAEGLPMYALVGTEGRHLPTAFVVGWQGALTAHSEEELMLFANDWPGDRYYGNNRGCVEVTIQKIADPPPKSGQ